MTQSVKDEQQAQNQMVQDILRISDSVKEEVYEGIARQTVADAIRICKATVMKERLIEAIEDAGRQGLVGRQEYQELKKEFAQ